MTEQDADGPAVEQMWQAYRRSTGSEAELTSAYAFGDTPAMADELAHLVLHGPKRATAGLLLEYEREEEPVPRPGDHNIVLGGRGEPVCIIRTTQVDIVALDRVDAAFAWDEGEGDRSLEWWQRAHRAFFQRQCENLGVPFTEDMPVVLDRFELVWPTRPDQENATLAGKNG
jgi:uncharacterized protein YhfF